MSTPEYFANILQLFSFADQERSLSCVVNCLILLSLLVFRGLDELDLTDVKNCLTVVLSERTEPRLKTETIAWFFKVGPLPCWIARSAHCWF